jgi:hypothetical protein
LLQQEETEDARTVYKATQVNEAAAGHEDDDNGMASILVPFIYVREKKFLVAPTLVQTTVSSIPTGTMADSDNISNDCCV